MANPIHIDFTEDSLKILDNKFSSVTDDRFIYCLQEGKWDMEDIVRFGGRIEIAHQYTAAERERLEELSKTYNSEYPTNHRRYFTTAADLMSRMRSTLSAYKTIVYEFRTGKRKRKKKTANGQTPLMGGDYSKDMFGWEVYDKKAKEQYDKLEAYLNEAIACVDVCTKVIDEENHIRQHSELFMPLYDDSFRNSLRNHHTTIQDLEKLNVSIDDDILKAMKEAKDVEQLISDLYHMLNHDRWNHFVISKALDDAKAAGIDEDELLLWGKENLPQILRVRMMLEHITELDMVKEKHKGKLSGYFMMRFCYWCQILNNSQHAELLKYVTRKLKGVIGVCLIGAVKAEKKKLLKLTNDDNEKVQTAFNQQLDDFLLSLQEENIKEAS